MGDTANVTVSISKGEFRTFGPYGPAYQVVAVNDDKRMLHIRVLETGEELDYPVARAAIDPEPA